MPKFERYVWRVYIEHTIGCPVDEKRRAGTGPMCEVCWKTLNDVTTSIDRAIDIVSHRWNTFDAKA